MRLGQFDFLLESVERAVPESVEPAAELAEAVRIDVIDTASAVGTIRNESRQLQRLEMLRDSRPTDRQIRRHLTHRGRAAAQPFEDGTTSRVAKYLQCDSVSHYLR